MVVMGISSSTYMISIMSSLQLLVPDNMRGRVMGFYGMTWSIMPLGGFQAGAIATFVGVPVAIAIGGGLVAAFALGPAFVNRQVRNIGEILARAEVPAVTSVISEERAVRSERGVMAENGSGFGKSGLVRRIVLADNMDYLPTLPDGIANLVYIDPPFNTGRTQTRRSIRTARDDSGDRTGFGGRRYRTVEVGSSSYSDTFDDYLAFLEPRLREARRILKPEGSFFLHVDYREVHYCKVLLDEIFGRESFINEIIWAYDFGARSKSRWPAKHDNILWYAKDPRSYTYQLRCDRPHPVHGAGPGRP